MNTARTILCLTIALAGSAYNNRGVWVIDANSKLTIQGSTNVNDFICRIEYYTGADTLQYVKSDKTHELLFTRSRMRVPVRTFDCLPKAITKDFRKTLRSDTYSDLEINFVSLQNIYLHNKNITGEVDITLAGVTARYTIHYVMTVAENGNVILKGIHAVSFSDFGLVAPEKFNGVIKVREVLKVGFDLVLRRV